MNINKILLFMFVLFGLIGVVNADAYNISGSEYNGINLSVSDETGTAQGITFNDNGSKIYVVGFATVFEYDCSTNFNMDTCSYSSRFLSVSAQEGLPRGLTFNNEGSKVFVIGSSSDKIFEYDCSTNFKIDTCSYSSRFLSVSAQDTLPGGVVFNDDGSKTYITGFSGKVSEYDCSTNFKIDTCSYSSRFLNVSAQDTFPSGLAFNNNGSSIFIIGAQTNTAYKYDCSINYKIDTCSYDNNNFSPSAQDTSSSDILFNNDGSNMYIPGGSTKTILEYTIFTLFTIIINNPADLSFQNITSTPLNISVSENTNLTYVFNGGLETIICNNCNSSTNITLIGVEGLNNLTIFSNLSGDLSNATSQFTIDTTPPALTVNLPTEYNFYTGFNFSNFINVSDTNLDTCIVTISGESSTVCTDSSYTFTTNGNKTINVTATDLAGNSISSLNNILLINPFQSFQIFSNAVQVFNFTINSVSDNGTGTVAINIFSNGLIIGSNSVLFEKLGFATTSINFTLNSTSEVNITTNVTESIIVIRIFDRETGVLLTGLTSITIQATTGFNGTTMTGLLNVSNINFISEQYQILAEHDDYGTETVFFNYNNQEIINIDIFMLKTNSTEAGQITIIVKNSLSQFVESAICSALEWRPSESAFVSVAQGLSNVDGEIRLNIQLNTVIYEFSCTKDTFTTITNAQIIQIDGSSLNIILNDVILAPVTLFPNLVTSLTNTTLNATHQLITYNFADSDGLTTEACIRVFLVNGNRRTFNSENCVSSSTGTILLTVDINQTSNILIQGTLTTPSVINFVTNSLTIKGTGDLAGQFARIGLDVIIPTILLLLGLGLGILLSKIEIAAVFMAIAGWVSVAFVPTILKSSIAMFITVIVAMMLWGGFNRK